MRGRESRGDVFAGHRTLLVGVHDNRAGINRKAFAADKPRRDARLHHTLKYAPKISLSRNRSLRARENAE